MKSNSFIPGNETIIAQPWYEITEDKIMTEGLCFDRTGENLYFVSVYEGKVMHMNMREKTCRVIYHSEGEVFGAVKVHRDGRLYVCSLGDLRWGGGIFSIDPEGKNREEIVPPVCGFTVDDLAFDRDGSILFTDIKGDVCDPCGGVYRVDPEDGRVTPFMPRLASPNGIAFTEDHKGVWVTEMNANRLLYGTLGESRKEAEVRVAAYLSGMNGPDSCCVDEQGNVYIAMYGQGRIQVVRRNGVPAGQILFPQSGKGNEMSTATAVIIPGACELLIGATDQTDGGTWLYKASAIAPPARTFQFL